MSGPASSIASGQATDGAIDESLFEFAPDAILIVDKRGQIVRANPQAEKLFGYTKAEFIGLAVEQLVPQRHRAQHVGQREGYAEAPHARRMGAQLELSAVRKDGSEFAVEVALGPRRIGAELWVMCIVRDITDRQRAKDALQRAHDQLEQRVQARTAELSVANAKLSAYAGQLERSNSELQDFAYVASHDLQEPLRKIQAFGDRLRTRMGPTMDPDSKDYLERMIGAAVRMQTLINDLLAFSRVSTRAQPFERVDLARIAREVMEDLEVSVEETHATVGIDALPTLEADPTQMRQLLQNLLGNALKFGAKDRPLHVTLAARSYVDEASGRRWHELTVSDTGIGFDAKYADRIFGLFQRLHGRGEYPGSGVGLAICRKIAGRHNGRITAEGAPGAGATFRVFLPESQP